MTARLLVPHHMTGGGAITSPWLKLAPLSAKAVGDLGVLSEALPGTLRIGRMDDSGKLAGGQGFDMNRQMKSQSPDSAAEEYKNFLLPYISTNPWVDAWTGPNEMVFERDDKAESDSVAVALAYNEQRKAAMLWYAEFCYQFAKRMHQLNKLAVIGSWPSGVPLARHNLWQYWTRALDATVEFGAIYDRHMYSGFERDGLLQLEQDQRAFTALGYPSVRLFVGECGIGAVENLPGSDAWRIYYKGDDASKFDQYWNQLLLPMLVRLESMTNIVGAAVFTNGGHSTWDNFSLDGTNVVERVALHTPSVAPVTLPPVVTPPPVFTSASIVGLHMRADGSNSGPDYTSAALARIKSFKLLSSASADNVAKLKQVNPVDAFFMTRLFVSGDDFRSRQVTPPDFIHSVKGDLDQHWASGVRVFEVHNEPNLVGEGLGVSWADGAQFGAWFVQVCSLLRSAYPGIRLVWPGLSPGDTIAGVRESAVVFLQQAASAPALADYVGVHLYWQSNDELQRITGQLPLYRWAKRALLVTEFSNPNPAVNKRDKAQQYVELYAMLSAERDVLAAFAFCVSGSNVNFSAETWRNEMGEQSEIPSIVGQRSDTPAPAPSAYSHKVNALALNVRLFPWAGDAEPPKVAMLSKGDLVNVAGVYKSTAMSTGWACITANGNQWVRLDYLTAL